MKRILRHLLVASSALVLASCYGNDTNEYYNHNEYYVMTLANKSGRDIAWFIPQHGIHPCEEAGALPESFGDTERNSLIFTAPGQRYYINVVSGSGLSPLEGYHVEDKVPFYVFDTAVLKDSSWTAIKRDSLWLACFEMSAEAVVENDYQLCYTE